jgi:hypothetical protein
MEKWNFRDCKIVTLRKTFHLEREMMIPALDKWLNVEFSLTEFDKNILLRFQNILLKNIDNWNEMELALNFIGPVFSLVGFGDERHFNSFSERTISGKINNIELSGKVDGMIASGKEEPEAPYFCLQEYKRETDPDGDPAAQALAAMLVAQKMNENGEPVYGAYIRGRNWFFIALEGNKFAISEQFNAAKNEIFDIFRILNGLRIMLEKKFNNQNI